MQDMWKNGGEEKFIGNLYYPQDLALKGISKDLLLDAAIDKEGKIKN